MDLRPRRVCRSELLFGDTLTINGEAYRVRPGDGFVTLERAHPGPRTGEVILYVVRAGWCSCPAYKFDGEFRRREWCKHLASLERHGLLPAATPAASGACA